MGGIAGRTGAAVHMAGTGGNFYARSVNVDAHSIDRSLQSILNVDEQTDRPAAAYRPSVLSFSAAEYAVLSDVNLTYVAAALGGLTAALFEDIDVAAIFNSRIAVEWHEWNPIDTGDDAVLIFQTGCVGQRAAQLYSSFIELKRWRIKADAPM